MWGELHDNTKEQCRQHYQIKYGFRAIDFFEFNSFLLRVLFCLIYIGLKMFQVK